MEETEKSQSASDIVNSFDSWINYIQGFVKGIEASKDVKIDVFNVCITEILEGMISNKKKIILLLKMCNRILIENEGLVAKNKELITENNNLVKDNTRLLEAKGL